MKDKPLITHLYTADPSAHVFNNKIYIYPSHDRDIEAIDNNRGDQYVMNDYHIFSMDEPYGKVTDHGCVLKLEDIPWASQQLWAPDAAYKNGKYYFYFPARNKNQNFQIGVAVSESPDGPFISQPDPIKGSYSIDPCIFIDDDSRAYLYFGGLWGGQLQNYQNNVYNPNCSEPDGTENAICPRIARLNDNMLEFDESVKEILIIDKNGNPIKAENEESRYFEGPWMHKYKNVYYLSYSTGTTHYIVYATADNPYGPFTYQGRIMEPVIGWTTHHSILQFKDKWFLFYHDSSLSGGINHKRCIKMTEFFYNTDGTIITITP